MSASTSHDESMDVEMVCTLLGDRINSMFNYNFFSLFSCASQLGIFLGSWKPCDYYWALCGKYCSRKAWANQSAGIQRWFWGGRSSTECKFSFLLNDSLGSEWILWIFCIMSMPSPETGATYPSEITIAVIWKVIRKHSRLKGQIHTPKIASHWYRPKYSDDSFY